jgi:hypothetical protein
MEIRFSGMYTDSDLDNMQRLTGLGKKVLSGWFPWTILVITAVVFFRNLFKATGSGPVDFGALLSPFIGPVCVILLLFWIRFRQKRLLNPLKVEMVGTVDEKGIHLKLPDTETHNDWDTFSLAVLTEDYVFLYPDEDSYFGIPRPFFEDEMHWTRFRELVSRKIAETLKDHVE